MENTTRTGLFQIPTKRTHNRLARFIADTELQLLVSLGGATICLVMAIVIVLSVSK